MLGGLVEASTQQTDACERFGRQRPAKVVAVVAQRERALGVVRCNVHLPAVHPANRGATEHHREQRVILHRREIDKRFGPAEDFVVRLPGRKPVQCDRQADGHVGIAAFAARPLVGRPQVVEFAVQPPHPVTLVWTAQCDLGFLGQAEEVSGVRIADRFPLTTRLEVFDAVETERFEHAVARWARRRRRHDH